MPLRRAGRGWTSNCTRGIGPSLHMNNVVHQRRVRVAIVAGVCLLASNTTFAALCSCPGLERFNPTTARSSDGPGAAGERGARAEAPCHSVPESEHSYQPHDPGPPRSCCSSIHSVGEIVSSWLAGPSVTLTAPAPSVVQGNRSSARWGDLRSQHLLVHDPPLYLRGSRLLI